MRLTPEAFAHLLRYEWPGNARELQRTLERMVLLSAGPQIDVEDLPNTITGKAGDDRDGIEQTLLRFERNWLVGNLREVDGDLDRAATRMGVSREELTARLQRFGVEWGNGGAAG
jgi:DNA-binding NtrC family response regulator